MLGSVSPSAKRVHALKNQQKKASRRILRRLDSVGAVAQELARVYRQARTGEIEGNETRTLIAALRELRACLEASDLEHRIEALEQGIVAPRASAPPPPGLKLISRHE
jgi:predicted ATPase with chaperone activity